MTAEFDTLDRVLARRHSCRGFRPDPVPQPVIEKIAAAAQRVPSWCNAQPWHLTVVSGPELERMRDALTAEVARAPETPDIDFPNGYSGIYRRRRSVCGWQLYSAVGVARGNREGARAQMMQNFRFFEAPHVAIVTSPAELGPYGAVDCGGYVTVFTLAAEALGVASIPQAAIAPYAPFLRAHLGLPEDRLVVCAISFGYEDPDHPANGFRTERAGLAETLTWVGQTEKA